MVTLRNVIDTRTGKYHSIVIVSKRHAKWFVPANSVIEEAEDESNKEGGEK